MKELEMNPYVIQIHKFVNSLEKLSQAFLKMGEPSIGITEEEYQEIYENVRERVCKECELCENCKEEGYAKTHEMIQEVMKAVEDYGAELNVELKRKIQKKCAHAP